MDELKQRLDKVEVTLTLYSKFDNSELSKTKVTPFRTQVIDNAPQHSKDTFFGVHISGIAETMEMLNKLITENKEMKEKIIKLQTK